MSNSMELEYIHKTAYTSDFYVSQDRRKIFYFVRKKDSKDCIMYNTQTGTQTTLFSGTKGMCDLVAGKNLTCLAFYDNGLKVFHFDTGKVSSLSQDSIFPAEFIDNDKFILCVLKGRPAKILLIAADGDNYSTIASVNGSIGDSQGEIIYKGVPTHKNIFMCQNANCLVCIVSDDYKVNSELCIFTKGIDSYFCSFKFVLPDIKIGFPTIAKLDENRIVFNCTKTGFSKLYLLNLENYDIKQITFGSGDDRVFACSSDGGRVFYEHINPQTSSSSIKCEGINSDVQYKDIVNAGVNSPLMLDDEYFYYVHASYKESPDLWRRDLSSNEDDRLTYSAPYIAEQQLSDIVMDVHLLPGDPMVSMKIYNSTHCGGKKPLLLWLHGGPTIYSLNDFVPFECWLASLGYVVCVPNYRGTLGYGVKYVLDSIGEGLGIKDVEDAIAAYNYCLTLDYIDAKKTAVAGVSYGSYLGLRLAAKLPQLSGAFVFGAITDWRWQQAMTNVRNYDLWLLGNWINKENFDNKSPVYEIENIKIPLYITHGRLDDNVPFIQVKEYVEKAEILNLKNIQHHFYENEGHGLPGYEYKNFIHWHNTLVNFLKFHLKEWNIYDIPYNNQNISGGIQNESCFNPVVFK